MPVQRIRTPIQKFRGAIAPVCAIVLLQLAGCGMAGDEDRIESSVIAGQGTYKFLSSNWKVRPGDDYQWRLPGFDDEGWTEISELSESRELPEGWSGIGWYRKRIDVAEDVRNRRVAFYFHHAGASELYVNGVLAGGFGVVGSSAENEVRFHAAALRPIVADLSGEKVQTLAIRYSNHSPHKYDRFGERYGPSLIVAGAGPGGDVVVYRARLQATRKGLFTGLPAMIALLHLLLFAFYPASRQNFYYAVLCASFAWLNYVVWDLQFQSDIEVAMRAAHVIKMLSVVCSLTSLRFIYSIFYRSVPRQFWIFVAAGAVLIAISQSTTIIWVNGFVLVALAEVLRAVVMAVFRKKPGAWIVGVGSSVFISCTAIQMLQGLGLLREAGEAIYAYGLLALLVSMSVYLALEFARTSIRLERRLSQVRALSDNLKEANLKLTDYSRTLEEKVDMRTREVSRKNTDLENLLRELRSTQEQLVMQEKMASLGNLVAGVAHEINNPIGAVYAAADVNARCIDRIDRVAREYRTDFGSTVELLRENNRITREASARIASIVKSLKSFARLDEATFQLADVNELIDTTITLLQHELGTRVTVEREFGDIPRIGCFPTELNQAFMNILTNAIQAIEGNGTIRITSGLENGKVVVSFADSGSGIPPEVLKKIFDPGFTTKGVGIGTGLGLSITYNIVKKHDGEVDVRSSKGDGTVVTVWLPTGHTGPNQERSRQ